VACENIKCGQAVLSEHFFDLLNLNADMRSWFRDKYFFKAKMDLRAQGQDLRDQTGSRWPVFDLRR
jgi:hypothetical protein